MNDERGLVLLSFLDDLAAPVAVMLLPGSPNLWFALMIHWAVLW